MNEAYFLFTFQFPSISKEFNRLEIKKGWVYLYDFKTQRFLLENKTVLEISYKDSVIQYVDPKLQAFCEINFEPFGVKRNWLNQWLINDEKHLPPIISRIMDEAQFLGIGFVSEGKFFTVTALKDQVLSSLLRIAQYKSSE